ncbi:MAG: hypothetical protein JKY32_15475 [Rhizobiales bacterium]|nr:hypothetical protein [Hyphomicrobiales bacterium]
MTNMTEHNQSRLDRHIDEALHVEPLGAALTGRIVANVRARAGRGHFVARLSRPLMATIGSAVAASLVGLGYVAGTLDPALFDLGGASELSIMLFEGSQNILEIL